MVIMPFICSSVHLVAQFILKAEDATLNVFGADIKLLTAPSISLGSYVVQSSLRRYTFSLYQTWITCYFWTVPDFLPLSHHLTTISGARPANELVPVPVLGTHPFECLDYMSSAQDLHSPFTPSVCSPPQNLRHTLAPVALLPEQCSLSIKLVSPAYL
jgi:hypothetical protein